MILQIARDIIFLLIVLANIIVGATFCFYGLTNGAADLGGDYFGLMLYLYQSLLLGAFENDQLDEVEYPKSAKFVFVVLTLFVLIVLLNLLIALMSDSFERIKEREETEYTHQTALMVVGIEQRYMRYSGKTQADRFPAYIHLLKRDEGQDVEEVQ